MKLIAFKRSQDPLSHPLFISEWLECSQELELDGSWETMIEPHFAKELSLNEERQKAHELYLRDQAAYRRRAEFDREQTEIKETKEAEREFRQFIQWKKNNKKKDK